MAATGTHRTPRYARLRAIDGRHPLKEAVPTGHVDYRARRLRKSEVVYFDFGLAKEMGLIPASHPDRMTPDLARELCETFSLTIINEWDFLNNTRTPARDLLPHTYMATRYLQLQHPDKRGNNSGDGRSVWNGTVRHRGTTWDVSSCGTGVTRLCPATSEHGKFFRTGNYVSSYGCGTAALSEGVGAALMSKVFHANGIGTERVLAVLELPNGLAINVRAAKNLLRPSHFFLHLKQSDFASLKAVVDFFIDRQIDNGEWPALRGRRRRYEYFAIALAETFARITATFESEYVFCWLDWDGDNILADGRIIDYGSVRQFGLYHREYRFEDTDRMSTTIPEQRQKARGIVKRCAQIRDFLITGKKRPLRTYGGDPALTLFDDVFRETKDQLLLHKLGFEARTVRKLMATNRPLVDRFRKAHTYFERARSSRGPERVPDGLTWNAIFCTRDWLRELPTHFSGSDRPMPAEEFIALGLSSFASRQDGKITPHRRRMAREFQAAYVALAERAATIRRRRIATQWKRMSERSAVINMAARMTGDAIDHAARALLRQRRNLAPHQMYAIMEDFAGGQIVRPERVDAARGRRGPQRPESHRRLLERMDRLVLDYREGL